MQENEQTGNFSGDDARPEGSQGGSRAPARGTRSGTVLIIDDSSTIRRAMSVYLERNGYEVVSAEDGFAGMRVLSGARPIIVFADIVMPRIDGYDFCVLVNSNDALKDIPVVLVSSKNQVFDRARAKVAGCRAFLSKPFTEQQLLGAIKEFARPDPRSQPEHPR